MGSGKLIDGLDTNGVARRPEIDLLLATALPPGCPTIDACVDAALSPDLHWRRLCDLARYHGVAPLLYQRLTEHAPQVVPVDVTSELASECRVSAARNLQLTGELIALAKAFGLAGVDFIPHKGPLLAHTAYNDLSLRWSSDLDLLVRADDLAGAIAVLAERGYRPHDRLAWLSPSALRRWTGEMAYSSPRDTAVDLHWRLTPAHYILQLDPEILWRSRTSITIAGSTLPSLAPEALALLLAVHGAKHCWEALGWVADLAWLLDTSPTFDWTHLLDLTEHSDCQRPLFLAVSLVHSCFEVVLPDWLLEVVRRDPSVVRLQRRVIARWYNHAPESPRLRELLSFAVALARRRRDSLKHFVGVTLAPTEIDWKTRRLPEKLFWLYAPARCSRLFKKYSYGS